MNIIDQVISSYSNNKSLYIGEKITIAEHMIQTAMIAEKNNCSSSLICSCLLHDYGHLLALTLLTLIVCTDVNSSIPCCPNVRPILGLTCIW